jgi:hypothetical protein
MFLLKIRVGPPFAYSLRVCVRSLELSIVVLAPRNLRRALNCNGAALHACRAPIVPRSAFVRQAQLPDEPRKQTPLLPLIAADDRRQKSNRRVTGTEWKRTRDRHDWNERHPSKFIDYWIRSACPLLLRYTSILINGVHCKRVVESNKPTCFEPPSLISISFVLVTLLFFSLIRQLQPRL